MNNIRKEPVLISVLAGNIIGLAAAFGFKMSPDQAAAIVAIISTVSTIIFGRANVTPNVSVATRRTDEGHVVAADASLLPNGTVVNEATPTQVPSPTPPVQTQADPTEPEVGELEQSVIDEPGDEQVELADKDWV